MLKTSNNAYEAHEEYTNKSPDIVCVYDLHTNYLSLSPLSLCVV